MTERRGTAARIGITHNMDEREKGFGRHRRNHIQNRLQREGVRWAKEGSHTTQMTERRGTVGKRGFTHNIDDREKGYGWQNRVYT